MRGHRGSVIVAGETPDLRGWAKFNDHWEGVGVDQGEAESVDDPDDKEKDGDRGFREYRGKAEEDIGEQCAA